MRHFSKSKLLAYRQCPKRLWLEIHRPEWREDSAESQARFAIGYQVGDIARQLYDPEGNGALIDVEAEGFDAAFARTAQLVRDARQPIFEAGFTAEGALAFADVMLPAVRDGEPVWRMIEVKSSASVKDYHRDDVAVQAFAAQAAGVKLQSVSVAHIDSSWTYPGDEDYRGLLVEADLTAEALARSDEVKEWIRGAQQTASQPIEPEVAVGGHCYAPFECGFCQHCHRDVVQPEHPVDWLPNLSPAKRELFAEADITNLRDAQDQLLTAKQQLVKEHTLAKSEFFDAAGAASDLARHGFPARFLDFESIQLPIPIWKGRRPYQHIPFQFSLHTLLETGELSHCSFLDLSGNDPSEPFAIALLAACGESGPIFVYNAGFEKTRIRELAHRFAGLSQQLLAINSRIIDLKPIARSRYYHHTQQGSWSLKAVLPAAVPDLSYDQLDGVQDGGGAMEAFSEAIHPATTAERKAELERQLLTYCHLDTYALVRLWQKFSGREDFVVKQVG